jgi:hypothetical protein
LTLVSSTPNWWDTQQQAEGNHVSNIDLLDHDVGDSGSSASSGPDIAADVVIPPEAGYNSSSSSGSSNGTAYSSMDAEEVDHYV